ncbi:MAG TPA: hypothetical protein VHN37_09130 [Actinomycetota bacterium]|nr:hypothetical protein [Actinomycetota bacterium]
MAGFGATLALLSPLYVLPRSWRPWLVFAGTVVAIAIGWGTEETIFELAIFDPVDFLNQSLGAVVAGAIVLGDRGRVLTGAAVFVTGLAIVAAGFYFAFA